MKNCWKKKGSPSSSHHHRHHYCNQIRRRRRRSNHHRHQSRTNRCPKQLDRHRHLIQVILPRRLLHRNPSDQRPMRHLQTELHRTRLGRNTKLSMKVPRRQHLVFRHCHRHRHYPQRRHHRRQQCDWREHFLPNGYRSLHRLAQPTSQFHQLHHRHQKTPNTGRMHLESQLEWSTLHRE